MLSPARIIATREEAFDKYAAYLDDFSKLIGIDFHLGPLKDPEVARKKALRDYRGDETMVTDHVRAKGSVQTPHKVIDMLELFSNGGANLLEEHGIFLVQLTNNFYEPKEFTDYSALNLKLAVPVSKKASSGETVEYRHSNAPAKPPYEYRDIRDYHIVELQITAEQIDAVYNITHPYKRRAEDIYSAAAKRRLTRDEQREASAMYAVCRLVNRLASHRSGYDVLLKDPGKYSVRAEDMEELQAMVHHVKDYGAKLPDQRYLDIGY